jgi:uncharacterized protein (TIGR02594 family)
MLRIAFCCLALAALTTTILAASTHTALASKKPDTPASKKSDTTASKIPSALTSKTHSTASKASIAQPAKKHVLLASKATSTEPPDTSKTLSPDTANSSDVVREAKRWIGTNPTGWSHVWCARFMNFVLKRTGHQGTGSDAADSFASYGTRLWFPRVGAIAVMKRGKNGGHVGVVSGFDDSGNPIIISGNHNKRVGVGVYSRERVYAYVMPN